MIGSSYLFISIGPYIITDLIVAYGVIELKINYPTVSDFITIIALTGIEGGFILMFLSDYIGREKSLVIIHLLVTLSIFLILFARGNVTLLRASIGCFGFFYGAIWPMYAACVRDYFPKAVAGTVIGLLTIFYETGATLGPILAGYLTDVTRRFDGLLGWELSLPLPPLWSYSP